MIMTGKPWVWFVERIFRVTHEKHPKMLDVAVNGIVPLSPSQSNIDSRRLDILLVTIPGTNCT